MKIGSSLGSSARSNRGARTPLGSQSGQRGGSIRKAHGWPSLAGHRRRQAATATPVQHFRLTQLTLTSAANKRGGGSGGLPRDGEKRRRAAAICCARTHLPNVLAISFCDGSHGRGLLASHTGSGLSSQTPCRVDTTSLSPSSTSFSAIEISSGQGGSGLHAHAGGRQVSGRRRTAGRPPCSPERASDRRIRRAASPAPAATPPPPPWTAKVGPFSACFVVQPQT